MRVIVVEDSFFTRLRLMTKIRSIVPGADVRCFALSSRALEFAKEHTVDVAFVEMELRPPQMHGQDLVVWLQQINPQINLIFVAGTGDYAFFGWNIHISGYIRKNACKERIAKEFVNLRYPVPEQRNDRNAIIKAPLCANNRRRCISCVGLCSISFLLRRKKEHYQQ
ncbi:response regulator [Ruminococcaceae bacterium OttesenSCG-928-I18]|nr:response regulator [Ruminococcaceae bacterium OttesenSCG-928-I18]